MIPHIILYTAWLIFEIGVLFAELPISKATTHNITTQQQVSNNPYSHDRSTRGSLGLPPPQQPIPISRASLSSALEINRPPIGEILIPVISRFGADQYGLVASPDSGMYSIITGNRQSDCGCRVQQVPLKQLFDNSVTCSGPMKCFQILHQKEFKMDCGYMGLYLT